MDNLKISFNNLTAQRTGDRNQFVSLASKDSVSFTGSGSASNNKKKTNHILAYVLGGGVLIVGTIIFLKKRGAKLGAKKFTDIAKNSGESTTPKTINSTPLNELSLAHLNSNCKPPSYDTPPPKTTSSQPPITRRTAATQSTTIEKQSDGAYTQYANKLAEELKLKEKESLIKEALPDLMSLQNNDDVFKAVLGYINAQNKDFVVKTAVPAILRNSETLDLGKSMGTTLKAISLETVDCLDKLAVNAEKYKIKNQTDTLNILNSLTKENKQFAFNELFPYLSNNVEKYKITRGGYLAKYLDFITPSNKDFMFNEVIPIILKNAENADASDIPKIARNITKRNFIKFKDIFNNIEKNNIQDELGFFDENKLKNLLA